MYQQNEKHAVTYCLSEIFCVNEDNPHNTQKFCGCLIIIRLNDNLSLINNERHT